MRTMSLCAAVAVALTITACGGVNQTKLEPLYRTARAVEASTTTGVTYVQFMPLVQAFATEIAIARDKASTDRERALVDDYAKAAVMYQDSVKVWATKVRGERVPDLGRDYGFIGGMSHEERLQAIWAQAAVWMHTGHAVYNGTGYSS